MNIFLDCKEKLEEAGELECLLNGKVLHDAPGDGEMHLKLSENGLSLEMGDLSYMQDFLLMKRRIRNLNSEMLVKAVRIKGRQGLRILDATAGLGEDSFLMAAAGHETVLYEKDPVISALLGDALIRAENEPETANIASRMKLVREDSITAMNGMSGSADHGFNVVYLDPMFPERQKSGLIKKKFQLLHELETPCGDERALIDAALAMKPEKIVIKRPKKAQDLGNVRPSYRIEGSVIRYDVIVLR